MIFNITRSFTKLHQLRQDHPPLRWLTNSTPSRNFPTFHACDESRMSRLLVMILLHWMWKSWMFIRKYPKIDFCQLKKWMIRVAAPQYRKKNGKNILQGGNVQKQNVKNKNKPAAHLSFDLFSRNQRVQGDVLSLLPWSSEKKHVVYKRLHYIRKPWAKYAQLWPNWTLVMSLSMSFARSRWSRPIFWVNPGKL